jgi:hypothetical protein
MRGSAKAYSSGAADSTALTRSRTRSTAFGRRARQPFETTDSNLRDRRVLAVERHRASFSAETCNALNAGRAEPRLQTCSSPQRDRLPPWPSLAATAWPGALLYRECWYPQFDAAEAIPGPPHFGSRSPLVRP